MCIYRTVTFKYALNITHTNMVKLCYLLIPESKPSAALIDFPNLGLKMIVKIQAGFIQNSTSRHSVK